MKNIVEQWVNEWAIQDNNDIYREINGKVIFYSQELYHDYQPVQGNSINFRVRLENWLKNVKDEDDRKILFKMIPHIFYIGSKEFNTLYRVAYNELIASWLIDVESILFNDINEAKQKLDIAIKSCWICPITDSLNINTFFHINNISSTLWNEWRPQWYNIHKNENLWLSYKRHIDQYSIKRIVLLEDFVGSGSQIEKEIIFLLEQQLDVKVLLLPLINCPRGTERFLELADKYRNLTYKSVLELSKECFINENAQIKEHVDFEDIRKVINKNYNLTSGGVPIGLKPYSPFGYRHTGGLIVMFSNTPDNTIPSIHWHSKDWEPIFPRHSRN